MNKRKFSMILVVAMLLVWFAPVANAAPLLRVGSRGSQVKTLQSRLNQLGYNCGKADGIFGSRTRRAVRAFQRAKGLSVDGIAGPKTLAALHSSRPNVGATSPSKPKSNSNSSTPITSTLRVGSRGSQVKALQNRLNALGFNCGKADGIFGGRTRTAVRNFQRSKGLSVDGIVGRNTIAALFDGKQSSSSTTKKPTSPKTPNSSTGSKVPITSTLRVGSRGSQVKALQNKLNALGFNCGKADGIFGSRTRTAVRNFQRSKGLSVDGIVGRNTINALYSNNGQSSGSSTPKKPSTPKDSKPSNKVPITSTLRVGSRGSQVKALQNKLNALGFNCGKADGIFGSRTRTAVRNFQRSKGLSVDGIVGRNTINALYSNNGQSSGSSTPKKPSTPKDSKPSNKVPITSTLRVGSRGSQVKALQNRLNALGFNCGKADGIFGSRTRTAVRNFQRSKGLSVDGIVGRNTINALFSNATKPDSSKPEQSKAPVPNDNCNRFYGKKDALKGKIVVIDPGHGGKDPGASRQKIYEKDLVLDISTRLRRILKDAGATVVMTRDEDVTQSLFYRSAVANKKMLETEVAELNGRLTELDEDIVKLEEELNTAKETQVELQTLKGQRESLENELKDGECQDLAEAKKDQETEDTGETKAIEKPDEVEGSEEVEVAKVVEEDKKAKEAELQTINAEITELGTPKDPEAIGSQIEVKKDEQKKISARIEELTRYIKAVNSYVENPTQEKQQGELNASNGKIHDDLKAIFDLAGEKYQDNMVFVSIHVNSTSAAEQTSASGIRVFYKGNKNQTYYLDYDETARYNFANTLLDALNESTDFSKKTSSPSLDTRNLSVLREHNFVSALVEAGFINNPNDLQKLVEAQTREDIAAGIYNGIVAHFNKK